MISMESLDDDEDEDDEAGDISDTLNLPDLENINNPLLSNVAEEGLSNPKLGEIRQFSTETQTDLDVFLNNGDNWTSGEGVANVGQLEEFSEDLDFVTSNMETQTSSDLLLCANIYTQTGWSI